MKIRRRLVMKCPLERERGCSGNERYDRMTMGIYKYAACYAPIISLEQNTAFNASGAWSVSSSTLIGLLYTLGLYTHALAAAAGVESVRPAMPRSLLSTKDEQGTCTSALPKQGPTYWHGESGYGGSVDVCGVESAIELMAAQ